MDSNEYLFMRQRIVLAQKGRFRRGDKNQLKFILILVFVVETLWDHKKSLFLYNFKNKYF